MMFYSLNVALMLTGCLIFYKALLQKETFFPLNRFVLLGCLILSFSMPFVPVPQQWSFRKTESSSTAIAKPIATQTNEPANTTSPPTLPKTTDTNQTTGTHTAALFKDISIFQLLSWTYWLGVLIFAINFLVQLGILLYRAYTKPFIKDGRYRIVELAGDQAPCSFGNNIFINPNKYDWDTYSQIILHEKIHIQQGHSYDIMLAELAIVFQWFNPFAWLYRKTIENNLEFLTDHELLAHADVEPASYKMSLVKVSAPHFPISLTTNYNQSILKKRLIMMNAKKSNVNSTWKYLFIIPLLLLFVSFLNEPIAQANTMVKNTNFKHQLMPDEGTWFATIKDEKITIRFESAPEGKSYSSTSFPLADFKNLPKDKAGVFSLSRDAGTVEFTGRFEGNTGMGTYKFKADESFIHYLAKEGVEADQDKDGLVFFMINLNKSFIAMLKNEGYHTFSKEDLIPLVALNVNADFIRSLKTAGLQNLRLKDLIPLKALNVDGAYIADIKKSGYKNLTPNNLVTLKAQGIDGNYIKDAKNAKQADETMLAANETKKPKREKGSKDEFDAEMSEFGQLVAKKALNITAEFIKGFTEAGVNATDDELIALKSLNITPEYIKSFNSLVQPQLSTDEIISLKSLGISATEYHTYQKLGFKKLNTSDIISAKATGTTPTFIQAMRKKGYDHASIDRYIEMKVLALVKE